jgi:hypothetical protein
VILTGGGPSLSETYTDWCLSSPFHPLREKLTDAFAVAIIAVHRDKFEVENRKLPQNGSRVHSRDTLFYVRICTSAHSLDCWTVVVETTNYKPTFDF